MIKKINLLKINQWLKTWDVSESDNNEQPPPKHFFIGSVSLKVLRKLSNVHRRDTEERKKKSKEPGIQRPLELERSSKIARYIEYGYPLSTEKSLNPENYKSLIHPGWLPSAILINIIKPGEVRRKKGKDLKLDSKWAINLSESNNQHFLEYDDLYLNQEKSDTNNLDPLEIIDGQHRVYSIDGLANLDDSYEVPVVFFYGLSQAWQAYLFWVINVEPKKINPSLAFDLYPELRSQSWLNQGEGIKVYQDHRAQELTEILWRHPESKWRDRIELHGYRVEGHVSNASFIRSLTDSFIRLWGSQNKVGGLFGSIKKDKTRVLHWKRFQQAAFLIFIWEKLYIAVENSKADWVTACIDNPLQPELENFSSPNLHPAFAGPHTLLATDIGVRAYLRLVNATTQIEYEKLELEKWEISSLNDEPDDWDVGDALDQLRRNKKIDSFISKLCSTIICSDLDLRTSGAPGLSSNQIQMQSGFRGAPGYSLLEKSFLFQLIKSTDEDIKASAKEVMKLRGWNV